MSRKPVSFEDLREDHCRFPVTEHPPHKFCAEPKQKGSSFCPKCHRVAYQGIPMARRVWDFMKGKDEAA